jgi:hypothetical protein
MKAILSSSMMNWLGFGSREPACLKELIVKTGRALLVSSSLLAFVGRLDLDDQHGRLRNKTATSRNQSAGPACVVSIPPRPR